MPKLKQPKVEFAIDEDVVVSDVDFGEFHPTAQIMVITDLEKGGTFKGVGFEMPITRQQARTYMRFTEKMRPAERVEIDASIMKDRAFASRVFSLCAE